MLYQSLTRRLLTLPDSVEVYPAHGAGSSPAGAPCRARPPPPSASSAASTWRSASRRGAFVRALMTGLPRQAAELRPHHRPQSRARPAAGRASRGRCRRRRCASDRQGRHRAPGHPHRRGVRRGRISPARSTSGSTARSSRTAWACSSPADRPLVLVAGGPTDLTRAVQGLGRVGLDEIAGYLQWGMGDWKSQGQPVAAGAADQRARSRDHAGGAGGSRDPRRPRALRVGRGPHRGRPAPADGRGDPAARRGAAGAAHRGGVRGRAALEPGHQRARARGCRGDRGTTWPAAWGHGPRAGYPTTKDGGAPSRA